MSTKMKFVSAVVLTLMASQAMAVEDNVDVKVTGQIVPPACVPAMNGGAVFDYGAIKAGSLNADDFTLLGKKTLSFSLTCDSPMKVAFISTDGRAGTAVLGGNPLGINATNVSRFYGLGQDGGHNIGSYTMGIRKRDLKVDGKNGYVGIKSANDGTTWTAADFQGIWMDQKELHSIALSGTTEPVALKTLNGYIDVQAVINKGSELDLTKITNLDGQVTIQVMYL